MSATAPETQAAEDTLIGHLLELRNRLLRSVLVVVFAFLVLVPVANELFDLLSHSLISYLPPGGKLQAIEVTSTFFAPMKLAFISAMLITMPYHLYQAWAFVAPALYKRERRFAMPLLLAATILFYLGVAFAFFVMLPAMFGFFTTYSPSNVDLVPDINAFLSFVLILALASGISFEVPIAVLMAVIAGWVTPTQLSQWRGYIVILIAIVAAIITPPDGISMILLGVPMWLLYEIAIIIARLLTPKKKTAKAS